MVSIRDVTAGWGLARRAAPARGGLIVATLIVAFGFFTLYPIALIFLTSFDAGASHGLAGWSFDNWKFAFSQPGIVKSLTNTIFVFGLYTGIGFPTAVAIAWALARTNVPWSHRLEFMFWVSFMMPTISVAIGWAFLLDPDRGFVNIAMEWLPFVDEGPFNIYSVAGIVWVHLMANAISAKVMLLTPAFRNMNASLEEAARVSGGSNVRTMFRVTLPLMVPIMTLVFMLQLVRMFQAFEVERMFGTPIGFHIYSTQIFELMRLYEPPRTGAAAALASITLIIVAIIVPLQRWLTTRRQYTTVTGQFKPGLIDLGRGRRVVFGLIALVVVLLTVVPVLTLVGGSFMIRVGFFNTTPVFSLRNWAAVLGDGVFVQALRTTLVLGATTALVSPLLFSVVGYILARTRWQGRQALESVLWMSSAMPGMLASLGLLWMVLGTPGFRAIYGTVYILMIVVVLQGKLLSTQMIKGVYLQVGADMEEAARVAGAGWIYTYFRIWLPLLAPMLVLIGIVNFVIAAGTTSSIVLLASRDTATLALLALELMTHPQGAKYEEAGIVSLIIVGMTVILALAGRRLGLRMGASQQAGSR